MPIYSQKQAEEMRQDRAKVWDALYLSDNFQHQDKDVYTLAVEAIEERVALKAQKLDLEYRLDAQKETNRELCAIDNVGTLVHDLEVATNNIDYLNLAIDTERELRHRAINALDGMTHDLEVAKETEVELREYIDYLLDKLQTNRDVLKIIAMVSCDETVVRRGTVARIIDNLLAGYYDD